MDSTTKKTELGNVKVVIHYNLLRIYIDGMLHLSIKQDSIVGIKSYKFGKGDIFHIDFFTKDTVVDCNYAKRDIWEKILKGLEGLTAC